MYHVFLPTARWVLSSKVCNINVRQASVIKAVKTLPLFNVNPLVTGEMEIITNEYTIDRCQLAED